jgi:enoyl-CoA hydratase/carnithine racemase
METLIVERKDGVVTVTMNRPERKNAANGKMLPSCAPSSRRSRTTRRPGDGPDRRRRGLLLGADLGDPNGPAKDPSRSPLARMRRLGDVALALHHVTKPTIAKVDGFAVGAGLSLALGCDLVVCSDRAKLSMIFAKRGLSLDNGGSWLLPRLVGMARAKEIALFGGMWSGEEALAIGLVNRVVPLDELDAFVDDWATTLAAGPPLALSMTKTLLRASWHGLHGAGGGERGPLPGRQLLDPGHQGGPGRLRREAGAHLHLHRSLNRVEACSTASKGWWATPLVTKEIRGEHITRAGSGPGARSGSPSHWTPNESIPSGPIGGRGRRRARPARRLRHRQLGEHHAGIGGRSHRDRCRVVVVGGGGRHLVRCPAASRSSSRAASGWSSASASSSRSTSPACAILRPFVDKMEKVDMREFPMTGTSSR